MEVLEMRKWVRSKLTYANVISTLALFLVLGGGTALGAYVISSNSQVGPGTISGHRPPSGYHANVISGSVSGQDLAIGAVTSDKLANGAATNPKIANGAVTANKLQIPAQFTSAGLPDAPGLCGSIDDWVNWSPDVNNRIGYYRGRDGIVHLQGFAAPCGAIPTSYIFRLPAGYRPVRRTRVPAATPNAPQNAEVIEIIESGELDAGAVYPQDLGLQVSLDGISFRCGPSGVNGCP
jgi:hypothetical protein